jgi:hypothetical protein
MVMKDVDPMQLILTIIQISNGAYDPEEISQIIELMQLYEKEWADKPAVLTMVKSKEH